jgi:hypothetical protein
MLPSSLVVQAANRTQGNGPHLARLGIRPTGASLTTRGVTRSNFSEIVVI